MPLYELINPSDPYTFRARDLLTAGVVACQLSTGFGARCCDGSSDDSTPVLFGWSEWLDAHGLDSTWQENPDNLDAAAEAYESFLIGSPAVRADVESMLAMLPDAAARKKFIDDRQERQRSSMNEIGESAYKLAALLRLKAQQLRHRQAEDAKLAARVTA